MSVLNENQLLGAPDTVSSYQIQRSLRFNSSDSAYLSRTPASAGNRKTWTWAGWVKRSGLGSEQSIFTSWIDDSNRTIIRFSSSDTIQFLYQSGGTFYGITTNQVFRDASAWYHLIFTLDTSSSTSTNRAKIYVNGSQISDSNLTAFGSGKYPSQNTDYQINSTAQHLISARTESGSLTNTYGNYYSADIYFVDGQALDPTSFTEVSATTGQLIPKAYSGSYGTNGFHLDFADNSAATAAALGKDTSGNGNNWTPTNLSVTAGAGNDSLVDTPTSSGNDTGVGGVVTGNYCTWNPLRLGLSASLANGNLDWSKAAGGNYGLATGTIALPASGKWYWEITPTSNPNPASGFIWYTGVSETGSASTNYLEQTGVSCGYAATAIVAYNGGSSAYGNTYTTNDVIGVAVDMDNGAIYFAKNGTWQNSGVPTSGASKTGAARTNLSGASLYPSCASNDSTYTFSATANFGQRSWAYQAPAGFKALVDTNLPTPTIVKGSSAMDVVTYTGTGASLTPTSSLGFSPDLVWIKGRSGATDHALYDTVRGTTLDIASNLTTAETTQAQGVTAFNSNGFTVGTLAKLNTNAATYAAWCWDAGSSTVTNTAGTIQSSVRASPTAGFSVVSYTGNGTAGATIGHGLGVVPQMIITKPRSAANGWLVYHQAIGNTAYLALETTGGSATSSAAWNNTTPSSTVFTAGSGAGINQNTITYVAYCFAPVAGYSSFGSYTGSSDLPFIYTGFRTRWLLIKRTNDTSNWTIIDTQRDTYNVAVNKLFADTSTQENVSNPAGVDATNNRVDILSNGFKHRDTNTWTNGAGSTYIYAAFAENPFQYARAR